MVHYRVRISTIPYNSTGCFFSCLTDKCWTDALVSCLLDVLQVIITAIVGLAPVIEGKTSPRRGVQSKRWQRVGQTVGLGLIGQAGRKTPYLLRL